MKIIKNTFLLIIITFGFILISCKKNIESQTRILESSTSGSDLTINKNKIEPNQDYCSLSSTETFEYLYSESPFKLGGSGTVEFTKTFSYERDSWVENKITILGGRARLEGNWKVIGGSKIRVSNLIATNGTFDASRDNGSGGVLTINCNGDIEGMLSDSNGNRKDILIGKYN
jgi:hypothetical protein